MMGRRVKRILVVLDDIGPGDGLRSKFAIAVLRTAHPESRITLLVSEAAAEVFERDSGCDRVVVSHLYRAGIEGRWRNRMHKLTALLRVLPAVGLAHDLVLVLNWGTSTLDLLGRLAGGRVVGYRNRLPFLLSSRLGAYDVEGDPLEQNWTLLAAAGLTRTEAARRMKDPEPRLVSEAELTVPEPYAVLHVGSDWACQQWSQEGWAEVGDRLVDEYRLTVVFTGLAGEAAYIADIQALMRRPSISLAGSTTLDGLRRLLTRASLCVSVDSAPYELAQLTGTPVVVLAGPTSARPQMAGRGRPVVINRTPGELGFTIRACQRTHAEGHCHDYRCPFSQLPFIDVDEVMRGVGKLELSRNSPAYTAREAR